MMPISKSEVTNSVLQGLSSVEKSNCLVLLDSRPKKSGEIVRLGRAQVPMPADGYYVFVDLKPGANWGHPAAYFLVDSKTGKFKRYDDQFPPFSGDVPDEFVQVFRGV